MLLRVCAGLVAVIHGLFAVFVITGGLLVLRYPQYIWLHLTAVAWSAANLLTDLGCVLSTWEKTLWRRAGREPYPEGFLEHYWPGRPFAPDESKRCHRWIGALVIAINAAAYLLLHYRIH